MRVATIGRSRKLGVSMIPMIDVVFLLIIFFLVSSHLAQNETRIPLELPTATTGQQDENLQVPRLTINVTAEGQMLLAGRAVSEAALVSRFRQAREKHGDKVEVRIRCSRMAPYQQVEPIMLACTESGIWNVTYAVYRQGDL